MTRKEAIRQTHQLDVLRSLGFTQAEAEALRRISMTLHRWAELECGMDGGCIERDDTTNRPFWHNSHSGRLSPIADREAGALKRLAAIIKARNARLRVEHAIGDVLGPCSTNVTPYVQGDPRGAALYILRPDDVPAGADVSAYYNRGICVY
jgi:hypothetical protein